MAIQLKKWQWKSALTNTKSDFKRTFSFRKKHTHITKENGNNHSDQGYNSPVQMYQCLIVSNVLLLVIYLML